MAVGVAGGLIAGAIPGFTIAMAVVLTLPFTFSMPPEQGLATMVSVLVGGLSGGLMAGILTGIPGTPSSVATTFDGFPMARKGQPGLARAQESLDGDTAHMDVQRYVVEGVSIQRRAIQSSRSKNPV